VFTIFNDANASFPDQAEPDQFDFTILTGISGVLSGGAVTANSANFNLAVATGFVVVNGVPVKITASTVVPGGASANPRWDLVVVNSAGVASVLAGTASASNAMLPTFDPTVNVALYAAFIPASTTALTPNHLVDKRKPIAPTMQRLFAAVTDTFLTSTVDGDTTLRLKVTADGKMVWTPGNAGTPAPQLAFDGTLAGLLATGKFGATASVQGETPLTVTGAASQTADLVQVRSSTPTVLAKFDANGKFSAPNFQRGTGAPEGSVVGNVGDLYAQTDGVSGATLWVKETGSGNTGWHAAGTTSGGLILGGGMCPTGTIVEYAGPSLPGGWDWCDGAALSRTGQANLFAAIGVTYGAGDGSTTFNKPDKRGVVSAGSQNFGAVGSTTDPNRQIGTTVGQVIGERQHQQTLAELVAHSHTYSDPQHIHHYTLPVDQQFVTGGGVGPVAKTASTTPLQATTDPQPVNITIANAGGGSAFNVIQPTMLTKFIIKL
jgi:microcystin-dependent protein